MTDDTGAGYMTPGHAGGEYSRTAFRNDRQIADVRGLMPVKVMKVYKIDGKTEKTQGSVEEAGFVDVQPLISQMDGLGQKQDHETIYHVPYTRVYGGNAAIIMDPKKGDVGYVKVADRDISAFKDGYASGSSASTYAPGSRRRHDLADSVYLGGILSKTPKQYVTFKDDGSVVFGDAGGSTITMDGSGTVTIQAQKIVLNGLVFLGGTQGQAIKNVSYDTAPTTSKVKVVP